MTTVQTTDTSEARDSSNNEDVMRSVSFSDDIAETWLDSDDESEEDIISDEDEIDPATLEEMKKEFKERDKMIDRLTRGIHPSFERLMEENEQAVRKQMVRDYLQKQGTKPKGDSTKIKKSRSAPTKKKEQKKQDQEVVRHEMGLFKRLIRTVSFDVRNIMPGVLIILLNCVAYNGFTQIVRSSVVFLTESTECTVWAFLPVAMMLVGTMTMRATGGIYDWVDQASFARIKFDMTNRLRMGKWDAVIVKWFLDHENVGTFLNVLAFFTMAEATYAVQEYILSLGDIRQDLFENLPSVQQGMMTSVGLRLSTGLDQDHVQEKLGGNVSCDTEARSLYGDFDELVLQDEDYLASNLAAECYIDLMGSASAGALCSESVFFLYYAVSGIVAVVVLAKMGHKFWSI